MKTKPTMLPHVACPSCGVLSAIDYCDKEQEYIWWCSNDSCGKQYRWIWHQDGTIDAEPTGIKTKRTSVLLKLLPQKKIIYIVVKGMRFDGGDDDNNDEYFYNERTCPINYLNKIELICIGQDDDPHGLFEYVETINKRENVGLENFKI